MRTFLALILACGTAAAAPQNSNVTPYLAPQRLVAVEGGRRLNLYCVGHGSPTVLFDSGLATSMRTWRLVQPEVAKVTRACAYDRAGYGFSDPPAGVSDAKAAVADIHALLGAAHIDTPILYVGHSIAGLYGVLLQARHPQDVAAEVLVDPSFADQFFAMAAPFPPAMRDGVLASYHGQVTHLKKCAVLPAPVPEDCLDTGADQKDAGLAAEERRQVARPGTMLADASEDESFLPTGAEKSVDQQQIEAAMPNFGDKPLVILTHGNAAPYPGMSDAQNAAIDKAWSDGHDRLAALSTHGSNTVVPGSDHAIQRDHPQAVIDAVLKTVALVRAR